MAAEIYMQPITKISLLKQAVLEVSIYSYWLWQPSTVGTIFTNRLADLHED